MFTFARSISFVGIVALFAFPGLVKAETSGKGLLTYIQDGLVGSCGATVDDNYISVSAENSCGKTVKLSYKDITGAQTSHEFVVGEIAKSPRAITISEDAFNKFVMNNQTDGDTNSVIAQEASWEIV